MDKFLQTRGSSRRKIIAYCIIAIIFGTIGFGIFVNSEDIKVWPFNSPESLQVRIPIDYPPQNPGTANINNIILHIDITLTSATHDDVLARGEPISVDAIGFSYFQTQSSPSYYIGAVKINFEGAYSYYSATPENASIEIFNKTDVQAANEPLTPYNLPEIYWPAEGVYYPVIAIDFFNGSNQIARSVTQAFPNHMIYVVPASVLQDERNDHIYVLVTLAVLLFAFITGFSIVRRKSGTPYHRTVT